jgi:hypothetical protein
MMPFTAGRCIFVAALFTVLISCVTSPIRILFLGNSLSYSNGGIDYQIEELAGRSRPKVTIAADMYAKPYATLRTLWNDDTVHEMIARGGYDLVVLQEDIPETSV